MEKLIELLNEHAHTYADHYDDTGEEITIIFLSHADNCFQYVCDGSYETLVDDVVISKRFGFISWLVENDKIDLNKVKGKSDRIYYKEYGSGGFTCSDEELVLMLLAIQDEPMNFLISVLK